MTSALALLPEPGVVVLRRPGGTVTLRPAPRREPPFDDELEAGATTGPLDQPLPFPEWRPARRAVPSTVVAARRGVPDPRIWGRRLLVGIVETAAGKRPLHQLAALLSPGVAAGLGSDFDRAARLGRPHWTSAATVRSVRASEPADGIAELSATLPARGRVHAVALRLELRHGRWMCTRLVLG